MNSCIITPPFSPYNASPPLGPGILKGYALTQGVEITTIDLNARFINQFRHPSIEEKQASFIGDHAKNRPAIELARQHFKQSFENYTIPGASLGRIFLADSIFEADLEFDEINHIINQMIEDAFWLDFFQKHFFNLVGEVPIAGFSIMGPSQLLVAFALAALIKRNWKNTTIVFGGSHITLLENEIRNEKRYFDYVDHFFSGSCEREFTEFIAANSYSHIPGFIHKSRGQTWVVPIFELDEFRFYDSTNFNIPVQFSKGCVYGKCAFCTYPQVERLDYAPIGFIKNNLDMVASLGVNRFSIKDSLFTLHQMKNLAEILPDNCFQWSATTKISKGLNENLLALLSKKGCKTLEFGVESIHSKSQKIINKIQSMRTIEEVIAKAVGQGISIVVNLIYGLPGEEFSDAMKQVNWFLNLKEQYGALISGSHNTLDLNRLSPFTLTPDQYKIQLYGIRPWAYNYKWDRPQWLTSFESELEQMDFMKTRNVLLSC